MITLSCMVCYPAGNAQAQLLILDIIKAAVKKVIRQVDLHVQKMQNKTIALQNAQRALENTMAKSKLKDISGWMEQQRKLYDEYYQELKQVRQSIAMLQEVKRIAAQQEQILQAYKAGYAAVRKDDHFSDQERAYIAQVYGGIMEQSNRHLERLLMVVNSFRTQMSDGKRLELIAGVAADMNSCLSDIRKFNNQNKLLSLQRARGALEIDNTARLYNISLN